ncbi:prolyl oligopeptidase family serine peptidase [Microbacterium sp. ET2]|uniref:S9 family peptidase n=1 Tax=Microbacterium albipurpureum TaxID=3050384 RepID=UPI00259CEA85|nr:prolyl oligopeptidase family serine peptidase [Microbacterium sp. ET2 (Ac-2212)]WJL95301.1 prolyl oligopeptidase family serine peptidase [Microbacterium sp. ET2 (Ac-2212)]
MVEPLPPDSASAPARTLPFGTWPSRITADAVAAASPRLDGARFVGDEVWWAETVPEEQGRTTVRRSPRASGTGSRIDTLLPAPWNVRSRVHEYGGGAWSVTPDGGLVFVEKSDQRVWLLTPGSTPTPLTPTVPEQALGGLRVSEGRLLAVREVLGASVSHDIVEIPLDGSAADDIDRVTSLTAGSDFVAQPTLSPDGSALAWLAWNHPHMPWDRAEVRVRRLDDADPAGRRVAGGTSAALQPEWTADGALLYVDDANGYWNLHRLASPGDRPHAIAPDERDTGGPLWVLGSRWFAPLGDAVVAVRTRGRDELVHISSGGVVTAIPIPAVGGLLVEDADGTDVLVSGSPEDAPPGLWRVDLSEPSRPGVHLLTGGRWKDDDVSPWVPRPRQFAIDGRHGVVHAVDFPPTHPQVQGPPDALPPYVVLVHGGPTAHAPGVVSPKTLFLTSRGIGVIEVNYGGSSGFGRDYRERLRGQWGVVDVDDVVDIARSLAADGTADPARIAIAGGSAGGWTVLGALVASDAFSAGISRYGVADARLLAAETHDFEARYLDGLIGPLPDSEAVYLERSPLTHAHRIQVPVLLLQGADDAVVPPSQSEAIRDALRAGGVPHAYVLYPGEGHGFRRSETVVDMVRSELAFLGAAFGFPPDDVPPLDLDPNG